MVDAIGGAGKAGAEVFKEATKELKNASEQLSKFEDLRQKLEAQDLTVNKPEGLTVNKPGNENIPTQGLERAQSVQSDNAVNPLDRSQKVADIPKVTDMDGLEKAASRLKAGQDRLQELIDTAMSGKTFSPQELLGLQAEISQITTEISLCSKIVEQGVSSFKSTMQMQV